jgi:hypothetical protein
VHTIFINGADITPVSFFCMWVGEMYREVAC